MITETLQDALTEVRPLPIRYTADDLEFMPEDTNRYELIGGELFVTEMLKLDHQFLVSKLIFAFGRYLKGASVGEIIPAPGVIFSDVDSIIPDVVFASRWTLENKVGRKGEKFDGYFIAAPELIIEVLSKDEQEIKRDRVYKRQLYGDYGVKEYWVVDGLFNTIEVYRLADGGQQLVKRFEIHETIETALLPDFSLKLTDIFKF